MTWQQTFGDWVASRGRFDPRYPSSRGAVDRPPPFFPELGGVNFGPGVAGNQPTDERLLRASQGVFEIGVRAIANRLSTLELQTVRFVPKSDGTMAEEVIDDHPQQALFLKPHPTLTMAQLLRLAGQYIVTVGESYQVKVDSGLNIPSELHPGRAGHIVPIIEGGVIARYQVEAQFSTQPLAVDQVVRAYFPDPEDFWHAEGYLAPSAITHDSLLFAGETIRNKFKNNATPTGTFESTSDNAQGFDPDDKDGLAADWHNRHHRRHGINQGTPGVVPVGWKFVMHAIESGAEVTPLLEYMRDELLMATGTPQSVVGRVVSGDRSSAETNQFVFDLHTVWPIANLIAQSYSTQLSVDYPGPPVHTRFAEFVSRDKVFFLSRENQDLATKVRSVNQVREDRGDDPVDWGEDPVGTFNEVPYDPDGFDDLPQDDPAAFGGASAAPSEFPSRANGGVLDANEDARARHSARQRHFHPDAEWERQVFRERTFVPAWVREQQRIFKLQRDRTIELLAEQDPLRKARVSGEDVFDPAAWRELFAETLDPLRATIFSTVASDVTTALTDGEFQFTERVVEILQNQNAALYADVNNTTAQRINSQLARGTANGESLDQLAARVRRVFNARRSQANTIARNEVRNANQTAQLEAFDQSGVVQRKGWNTSRDEKVRDTHEIDGQKRLLTDAFTLGDGELAAAPGIAAGGGRLSAANAIGCRCFVTPEFGV